MLFGVTYGVRQVEIGLASLVSLLFGLTVSSYGLAILASARYLRWLGTVALPGSLGTFVAGVVQAHQGFSAIAMHAGMPSSVVLLLWLVIVGVQMWQQASRAVA